jgi:hypothetical protein
MNIRNAFATGMVLALAATAATALPASAKGGDVVRRGSCSGSTDWKIKAKHEDGRIEVEGEIDSNHNGQTWHWRIRHNGSSSASGTATTKAPSGSFERRRLLVDIKGTDKIEFRADHGKEVCAGTVRF